MMKLSIVVPVYNVEAYLQKCVASLLAQNLPQNEYEIILIDDGSTDTCAALCDDLASTHGNIRVKHQQNQGLSGARNTGIANATGKYIQFVDSDDYLCPNVLCGLVRQMEEKNLDILRFNYQNVNEAGEVFEPNKYVKPFVDYSDEVCDGVTFLNERLGFACYACQYVVKASILHQAGIVFKEGIYYEDVEWTPRILLQANRVASTSTMVYNYLFRTESIARNKDINKIRKAVLDKMSILEKYKELSVDVQDKRWFEGMSAQIALSILYYVGCFFYQERQEYIAELRKTISFPLSTFHATSSAKRKIRLSNLSPYLVCWLYHWL